MSQDMALPADDQVMKEENSTWDLPAVIDLTSTDTAEQQSINTNMDKSQRKLPIVIDLTSLDDSDVAMWSTNTIIDTASGPSVTIKQEEPDTAATIVIDDDGMLPDQSTEVPDTPMPDVAELEVPVVLENTIDPIDTQNTDGGIHDPTSVNSDDEPDGGEQDDEAMHFDVESYIQGQLHAMNNNNGEGPSTRPSAGEPIALDDDNEEALEARYLAAKREYKRKERRGELTTEDEIAFIKLKNEEKARLEALRTMIEAETFADAEDLNVDFDNESLFVPENSSASRKRDTHPTVITDDEDDDGDADARPAKKSRTNKGKGPANSSAKRAPKNSTAPTKSKRPSKPKKPTKKQLQEMHNARLFTNMDNLTNPNMLRDVENNQGVANANLAVVANRRKQALNELIASIPLEHRDEGSMDAAALFAAVNHFTPPTSCKPDNNGEWKVDGLLSSLSPYQMLGASFMRRQERQTHENPRGGIVADAMGLGKTVMMIANIVNGTNIARKSKKDGKDTGTTLIVAPSSLVHQWQGELIKHGDSKKLRRVTRYCAGSRGGEDDLVKYLSSFNIVITTYSDVAASYPKKEPPLELTDPVSKETWWRSHYERHKGAFHKIQFHRIILDEAQAIKNHKSITSIACRAISATHRWAISGTPVQNTLSEFYPYFKFLLMKGTGDFKAFKSNFCTDDDPAGGQRLAAMLRKIMLRRTHGDTLMGQKLLDLPPMDNRDYICHLSDIERGIYEVVHKRFIKRINVLSRNGQLKKHYNNVLVMLLRLRQLVAHPLLIQDTIKDLLEKEDFVELEKVIKAPVAPSATQDALIKHIRRMLRSPKDLVTLDSSKELRAQVGPIEIVEEEEKDPNIISIDDAQYRPATARPARSNNPEIIDITDDNPLADDAEEEKKPGPRYDDSHIGGAFGLKTNYGEFLTTLREAAAQEEEEEPIECALCFKVAKDPVDGGCGHSFCNKCLQEITHVTPKGTVLRCIRCKKDVYGTTKNATSTQFNTSFANAFVTDEGKKKVNVKAVIDTWVDAEGLMLPSAKTLAFKAQVLNWLQNEPNLKIIVYSQFITMLRILGKVCQMEGWDYRVLIGQQSIDKRSTVIKEFNDKPEIRILLASLKTGGTGLNLTCASRVLLVDLWWNSSVEQQAFARTYRRGQEKETRMTRLIAAESVDTDMVSMQLRKDNEINNVLANPNTRKQLTLKELMSLFGEVKEDESGRSFIMVEEHGRGRVERVGEEDDDGGRGGRRR